MSTDRPSEPPPAATVVLIRPTPQGPEILLTHRPATMAFGPGLHVFPGGRVDPGDADPRLLARSARSPGDAAHALGDNEPATAALAFHVAAIRELFEEAGVLLADGVVRDDKLTDARARLLGGASLADALDGLDLHLRTDLLLSLIHI